MKKESPKLLIHFEPESDFKDEFSGFINEVLNWSKENNGKLYQNTQRNNGNTCQNEVKQL